MVSRTDSLPGRRCWIIRLSVGDQLRIPAKSGQLLVLQNQRLPDLRRCAARHRESACVVEGKVVTFAAFAPKSKQMGFFRQGVPMARHSVLR